MMLQNGFVCKALSSLMTSKRLFSGFPSALQIPSATGSVTVSPRTAAFTVAAENPISSAMDCPERFCFFSRSARSVLDFALLSVLRMICGLSSGLSEVCQTFWKY